MIPLRLKSNVRGRQDRFVVRLNAGVPSTAASAPRPSGGVEAYLEPAPGESPLFVFDDGSIELAGANASELAGDVLLIDPASRAAHRLIRARSPHNTFLITEQCDQLCIMCSQPPKKGHEDMFPHFSAAVDLAPHGATIGLSGGEPTLHKEQLFDFLGRAHDSRPDIQFHILTNAQHFSEGDLEHLREMASWGILWGIPLYAADRKVHDEVVQKPGAFERLLSSFAVLLRAGAAIELRTAVLQQTIEQLPRLASFVAAHLGSVSHWAIMQLENAGYARTGWQRLFFDTSSDFQRVGDAIAVAAARGVHVTLYNFPLCTVPAPYRAFAEQSISDWKQKYLPGCEGCSAMSRCGGFFEWYEPEKGFREIGAL